MVLLSVLFLSVVIGLLQGGRLSALGLHPWRHRFLPFVALALQVVAFLPDESASRVAQIFAASLHISSYVLLLAFVWANGTTPWVWLIGAGLAANGMAIVANGGFMPVAPSALAPSAPVRTLGMYNNSVLMTPGTRLWFLGDVVHLPHWFPVGALALQAFSIGDALIGIGLFLVVQGVMQQPVPNLEAQG